MRIGKIDERLTKISQSELKYTYESAKSRMKIHPEIAAKSLKIVEDCPHFDNEKEATEFAIRMAKETHSISKIKPRECPLIKFKGRSFFFFHDIIHDLCSNGRLRFRYFRFAVHLSPLLALC